jgi:hypothetical protein
LENVPLLGVRRESGNEFWMVKKVEKKKKNPFLVTKQKEEKSILEEDVEDEQDEEVEEDMEELNTGILERECQILENALQRSQRPLVRADLMRALKNKKTQIEVSQGY